MIGIRILLSLFLLLTSCGGKKSALGRTTDEKLSQNEKHPKMELLSQGSYGGGIKKGLMVIQEPKEFELIYRKLNRTKKIEVDVPSIDFSQEVVVLYQHGETKGTLIPSLKIIGKTQNTIILEVLEQEDKNGGRNITQPFCMYTLTKISKKMNAKLKND